MKKILVVVLMIIILTLSACKNKEEEEYFVDISLTYIDISTLQFTDVYWIGDSDMDQNNCRKNYDIIDSSIELINHSNMYPSRLYSPDFPSYPILRIYFENDDFDDIVITVYAFNSDSTSIYLGIDLNNGSLNSEMRYYSSFIEDFSCIISNDHS